MHNFSQCAVTPSAQVLPALSLPKCTAPVCATSQVHIYFPEIGHPAFGIVRAIVKDSLDVDFGLASETFLDSDGQVGLVARYCIKSGKRGCGAC